MDLPADQIQFKREVGKLNGEAVCHIAYKGGLNVIAAKKSGRLKLIALGPHQAVAKHLASKYEPDIKWESFAKSEYYPIETYSHLLPKWEKITEEARAHE